KPFIFTIISSAIGGAMLGGFGTVGYVMGGLGVFQIPSFIPESGIDMSVIGAIIAAIVGFVLAFALSYFFGGINKNQEKSLVNEKKVEEKALENENTKVETIVSPLSRSEERRVGKECRSRR